MILSHEKTQNFKGFYQKIERSRNILRDPRIHTTNGDGIIVVYVESSDLSQDCAKSLQQHAAVPYHPKATRSIMIHDDRHKERRAWLSGYRGGTTMTTTSSPSPPSSCAITLIAKKHVRCSNERGRRVGLPRRSSSVVDSTELYTGGGGANSRISQILWVVVSAEISHILLFCR